MLLIFFLQEKHWEINLVKPELSQMDPEKPEKGLIVTHSFQIPCNPEPSSILINTKEKKMTLSFPNKIGEEISLEAVAEQKNQCRQKIFYPKKNHPVWDRWGRDVAQMGSNVVVKSIPVVSKG